MADRPQGRPGGPPRGGAAARPGARSAGSSALRRAAGPLGRVVYTDGSAVKSGTGFQFEDGANALVLLHRVAFSGDDGEMDKAGQQALLRWAEDWRLGQAPGLVAGVAERRRRALAALAARRFEVIRLAVAAEWRMAAGLGNKANAHEIGLALHGTYGWPVIPGSSVKGLAAAYAAEAGAEAGQLARIFGYPRPAAATVRRPGQQRLDAEQGTVRFLDAIPLDGPVQVVRDVLTPHVKPYYDDVAADRARPAPPAEYHKPVPVEFLVVSGGTFAVDLAGADAGDVEQAAVWCEAAFGDLGIGAKTSSGYGYLTVARRELGPPA
jgi:CRISPR-associated protein Cmr6